METIVQEIANVGFTILVFCIGLVIVNKFKGDKQMVELICRDVDCDNVVVCDTDVVAVTCGDCCATLGVVNNITFGG